LKKGADRGAKDKDGDTPLDAAKKHNRQDVVDILSKP
jgi:ankyrin repeat protein